MPTEKEKIVLYIDLKTKIKFQFICKLDMRSMSNYITRMIDREIIKYELENGEIKL